METLPIKVIKGDLKITDKDALVIDKAFKPAIDKMLELAPEVVEVLEMEESDDQEALAKELYGKYVKIRTATDKIHKAEKSKYTVQAKYCDLHKNTRKQIGDPIEAKLKEIRDSAKIKKEKEISELQKLRENEIAQYLDDTAEMIPGLGEMNEIIWANLLSGTKSTYLLNKKISEESSDKAKKQADYQAETMRRYNLLMPLQKFVTEDNKKNYASFTDEIFNAILVEAQMLSNEADLEIENIKKRNVELEKEIDNVIEESKEVVQSLGEITKQKVEARLPGATDKEKMTAFALDLKTLQERYTFTDPKYVNVGVQCNNYISQLITNIESFNNQNT